MSKRVNKYLYGWKLYVNYGGGWEYETFNTSYREAVEERRDYRNNCPYPVKLTYGREPNPEYVEEGKLHASN